MNEFPKYSTVSNKRSATFINFWIFFQGLRSYLGGTFINLVRIFFEKKIKLQGNRLFR